MEAKSNTAGAEKFDEGFYESAPVRERPPGGSVRVEQPQPKIKMKSGMRDQVEGKAKEIKGAAKQELGKATGDPAKKAEGKIDSAAGKVQQKVGQIKRDATRD